MLPNPTVSPNFVKTDVTITLEPTDTNGSGIDRTVYTIDTGTVPGAQIEYNAPFTITTDGTTTIKATTYDKAGNPSTEATATVKIDKSGPVVSANLPTPLPGSNGYVKAGATVALSATDAGSGVKQTFYTLNGESAQLYTGPFPVSQDGPNLISAWATDNLDNQGTTVTVTVNVDAAAPAVELTVPTPVGIGTTATFSYLCTDPAPGSGLLSIGGYTVLINGAAPTVPPTQDLNTGLYTASIDTTTLGTKTVEVTATDNAGSVTKVTRLSGSGTRSARCMKWTSRRTSGRTTRSRSSCATRRGGTCRPTGSRSRHSPSTARSFQDRTTPGIPTADTSSATPGALRRTRTTSTPRA